MNQEANNSSVVRRVKKLFAIANDSAATEAERETAMRMAHSIIAKYNLDQAEIESSGAAPEKRIAHQGTFYGRPWARIVAQAIADMCFCSYVYHPATEAKLTRHRFIGKESNAISAAALAEYLVESIRKQAAREKRVRGAGNEYARSFATGASHAIYHRVKELVRKNADLPMSNGRELVLASLYQTELAANRELLATMYPKLRDGRKGKQAGYGYSEGHEYGNKVGLNHQVAGDSNHVKGLIK